MNHVPRLNQTQQTRTLQLRGRFLIQPRLAATALFVVALTGFVASAYGGESPPRRLPRSVLLDNMKGNSSAQTIGVEIGEPTEPTIG